MFRMFTTHKIRKYQELTGKLWDFVPGQGEHAQQTYQVLTPNCWESLPDFAGYRGEGDYTTTFMAGGQLRFEFKGVSHTATVFLDGKKIASHYNAYTIFSTVVKDVPWGEHTLTIRADNRFSEESALHLPNDYMSYGGVSRPVILENVSDTYLKWCHVTPYLENDQWRVKLAIQVANISAESKTFALRTEIAGMQMDWGEQELAANSEKVFYAEQSFTNVQAWQQTRPKLYLVSCQLLSQGTPIDDLIDRFGFREIKVVGKNIQLNGQNIRIKGFCRHEDHPQFGCALPLAAMAADLALLKDLGANSIRTSHYPNDELFLDLCDEQGILVWEENHARGLTEADMRNPHFEPQAEQVIAEMVQAHYNHPAIYIWGILNECASDTEYGRSCYAQQFSLLRRLDKTRPCSFASCKFKTDKSFGLPDVVAYNIYPQWYHDAPVAAYLDDLYQWVQRETAGAGKPFMITEIGAGGLYGYHNPQHSKWTEDYQAEALKKQLQAVLSDPNCLGVYIWQFCDVRVSEEWFDNRPRTMNNKGIVDEFRRPKMAYQVVKQIFEELA